MGSDAESLLNTERYKDHNRSPSFYAPYIVEPARPDDIVIDSDDEKSVQSDDCISVPSDTPSLWDKIIQGSDKRMDSKTPEKHA